jgi:cytochrome P450
VLDRLSREVRAGEDAYLLATVNETLRRRPVLANAEPRLTMREVEIGGWTYPSGAILGANAYLVHHDPAIYPDPYAFRPERWLEQTPGTYTFLPFGGGRRRCIGAAFATSEMQVVLRALLQAADLQAAGDGHVELTRRRNITLSPGRGARAVLAPV